MTRPRIAIYGQGYVGRAVAAFLEGHYPIVRIDPAMGFPNNGEGCSHAVICVPTPALPWGQCDTSIVELLVADIGAQHAHILIKSTVPPGTTDALDGNAAGDVCFSPEYVGEGGFPIPYWEGHPHPTDMAKHSFHIFGGHPAATSEWVTIWQRAAGWGPRIFQTDAKTAELTKYAENAYLATKKVFCSELALVARAMGVDYHALRELWLLDTRIGRAMTMVYPDQLAFGGKCLPKDTAALLAHARAMGVQMPLLDAVIAVNNHHADIDAGKIHD